MFFFSVLPSFFRISFLKLYIKLIYQTLWMWWRKFKNNKLYIKHHDWAENVHVKLYKCIIIYRNRNNKSKEKMHKYTKWDDAKKKQKNIQNVVRAARRDVAWRRQWATSRSTAPPHSNCVYAVILMLNESRF